MEKTMKAAILLLLVLISFSILSFFINISVYRALIKEDGCIEYTTAFLLFITSFFIWIKVIKNHKTKCRLWIVFNVLMGVGLFFGFGEELSCGQRIFNLRSNEFFLENNLQDEINIHNLSINGIKFNKWIFTYLVSFVFGAYFFLSLIGYKKSKYIKQLVDKLGVPLPKVKHIATFAFLSIVIFMLPDDKKWELWECLFSLILLSICIDPYNTREKLIRPA